EPATVYVVYAPYLPHGERHQVGGWELIPRKLFEDADALDPRTAELARGYVDLFALPDGARTASIGAYARPVTGSVGDEPASYEDIQDLRRALLVAVLDGN